MVQVVEEAEALVADSLIEHLRAEARTEVRTCLGQTQAERGRRECLRSIHNGISHTVLVRFAVAECRLRNLTLLTVERQRSSFSIAAKTRAASVSACGEHVVCEGGHGPRELSNEKQLSHSDN